MKVDSSKAKKPGGKDDNISDAEGAASDNSDDGGTCSGGGDDDIKGKIGDSVAANGGSGKVIKDFHGHIPAKYKKYVKAPKFDKKYLAKSQFGAFGCAGQCTELTWAYMTQMWTGEQPSNGNGHDLARSYKARGAKVTNKPTVGYGFSSDPPYAGSGDAGTGHTGVVVGVLPGGKWILANYNLHLEAPQRHLTYALVDGNPKKGGTKFFSGVGKVKKKYKK
jgi:surface antigen